MSFTSVTMFALGIALTATAGILHRRHGGLRQAFAPRPRTGHAPRLMTLAAALVMSVCGFQAAANASVNNQNQAETASSVSRTPTESSSGQGHQPSRDYAARQAQSKKAENFEGGSTTIVIGSSALVVILVVLLIVIIL